MKLGIFGDSYADPNPNPDYAWSHYLTQSLQPELVTNFSRSGTSHWWSYENFLKNYSNFDTIVFCHTTEWRWPHVPEELVGYQWDLGSAGYDVPDTLRGMNKFFFDIFSKELLTFISSNIFKSVNDICNENGIKLVNVTMYDQHKNESVPYPILSGVDEISYIERTVHNGQDYNFVKLLTQLKRHDCRANHLIPANNQLLADLILTRINDNTQSYTKLLHAVPWHTHDPITNDWFL